MQRADGAVRSGIGLRGERILKVHPIEKADELHPDCLARCSSARVRDGINLRLRVHRPEGGSWARPDPPVERIADQDLDARFRRGSKTRSAVTSSSSAEARGRAALAVRGNGAVASELGSGKCSVAGASASRRAREAGEKDQRQAFVSDEKATVGLARDRARLQESAQRSFADAFSTRQVAVEHRERWRLRQWPPPELRTLVTDAFQRASEGVGAGTSSERRAERK